MMIINLNGRANDECLGYDDDSVQQLHECENGSFAEILCVKSSEKLSRPDRKEAQQSSFLNLHLGREPSVLHSLKQTAFDCSFLLTLFNMGIHIHF
jgi:hypothetical protein